MTWRHPRKDRYYNTTFQLDMQICIRFRPAHLLLCGHILSSKNAHRVEKFGNVNLIQIHAVQWYQSQLHKPIWFVCGPCQRSINILSLLSPFSAGSDVQDGVCQRLADPDMFPWKLKLWILSHVLFGAHAVNCNKKIHNRWRLKREFT